MGRLYDDQSVDGNATSIADLGVTASWPIFDLASQSAITSTRAISRMVEFKPVRIDLTVNELPFEQAAFRFGANREFDICEFSFANYARFLVARR